MSAHSPARPLGVAAVSALDVQGILERAGADADAPEGSQAWSLALVAGAHAELALAAKAVLFSFESDEGLTYNQRSAICRLHNASSKVQP